MKTRRMKWDSLDELFSKYIRTRDGYRCRRCGTPYPDKSKRGLDCAHIHGRGKISVRFDTDNAVALCYGCHRYLDTHPFEKMAWALRALGQERFDALAVRAATTKKIDREMIRIFLKQELEKLQKQES